MDGLYDLLSSPAFAKTMHNLAIASLVFALGMVIVGFTFYGRAREADGDDPKAQRWVLLMATWRDSLIITLLYGGQGFIYRYMDFMGLRNTGVGSISEAPWVVGPVLMLVLDVLIFIVAAMRIVAITRWLAAKPMDAENTGS